MKIFARYSNKVVAEVLCCGFHQFDTIVPAARLATSFLATVIALQDCFTLLLTVLSSGNSGTLDSDFVFTLGNRFRLHYSDQNRCK